MEQLLSGARGAASGSEDMFPSPEEIAHACAQLPGQNILEVDPDNIRLCFCGSYQLVSRDLRAALPASLAEQVSELLTSLGVSRAFFIRRELINYKKVLHFMNEQGAVLERSLAQLNTFLNYDPDEANEECGYTVPSMYSAELMDTHMRCKGRSLATADLRRLCRDICNLPRHPAMPRRQSLEELPRSLKSWVIASEAAAALAAGNAATQVQHAEAVAREAQREAMRVTDEESFERSSLCREADAALDAQPWPEHIRSFVRAVLVGRGGDKALRIQDELRRLIVALESAVRRGDSALANLINHGSVMDLLDSPADPKDFDGDQLCVAAAQAAANHSGKREWRAHQIEYLPIRAAKWRQRHLNLLSGSLPPLREALKWLQAIESADATESSCSLFRAGDVRQTPDGGAPPALFVPMDFSGCKDLDLVFQNVILSYKPKMLDTLAARGWPSHICSPPEGKVQVHKRCRKCNQQFASALWVHRYVCSICEDAIRNDGRCPFGKACLPSWFCKHHRRCFACDAHSCTECRILRGDGEIVRELVDRLKPDRIALDFDRTLCNTKSGNLPVIGTHVIDTELLGLMQLYADICEVVTRNPHKDEILAFLAANGVAVEVPVRTLKRPRSKAEFVVAGLSESDTVVFVDDSIQELLDPCIASDSRVYGILFVRAMM